MRITLDAASACTADLTEDARTISGVVVPYGIPGSTSLGKLEVDAGAVTMPEDLSRIKLTREHDRTLPRGYGVAASDGVSALEMTFRVAKTPDGDEALLEASERVRDGLSVDLDDVTIKAGHITAGRLIAVGQVAVPAYESARVAASETTTEEPPPDDNKEDDSEEDDEVKETDEDTTETSVQAATVPVGIPRGNSGEPKTLREFYGALTGAHRGTGREVRAALQNITHTANEWVQPTQYAGELWTSVAYERSVVPLLTSGSLTSYNVVGWRWVVKPVVAAYAGDKTAVPSNAATTEQVTVGAERLAGAHDFDRKFRDFNDTEFFSSYYAAMAESYAEQSDAAALGALVADATAFTPTGTTPSGFDILVQMCMALLGTAKPTFAIVGANVIQAMASTTAINAPTMLNLLPDAIPPITVHPGLDPDNIIVGAKQAATFYELPGVPIRVEAIDMVNGGVDAGVFGYYAVILHQPAAVLQYTLVP